MAVSNLLIGVVGAMLATNQPAALSNLVTQTTGISVSALSTNAIGTNSPLALGTSKNRGRRRRRGRGSGRLDSARTTNLPPKAPPSRSAELNRRIRDKFDVFAQGLHGFHPAPSRITPRRESPYASFLHDLGDEDGEFEPT